MWLKYICFFCLTITGAFNLCSSNSIEVVTTSSEAPLSKLQETEWDLSQCQEEIVSNEHDIYSQRLHPLTAAESEGAGAGGALRLAVRGDGSMRIYLSRERRVDNDHGHYFIIFFASTGASLYARDPDDWSRIQEAPVGADISTSQFTRVALVVADDLVELRVGNASTPLLSARDPRITRLQYFGFDTFANSEGNATFKYGC